ncbi:MAG: HPF/RaiA family ribosome-associated protein [Cyclobacteriaceae bacterium]
MRVIIQTPDFKASKKLTEFVRENVEKISFLSDRVLEGQVLLKVEKSATNENKICQLKVIIPGNDIFASRQSTTFEEAVSQAVEAAEHQIMRWKESRSGKQVRGSFVLPEEEETFP